MESKRLKVFVATVVAGSAIAVSTLPTDGVRSDAVAVAVLAALAALVGWRPVRFVGHGSEASPTHPLILCALAGLGSLQAVTVAAAGVLVSILARGTPAKPIRSIFNVAGVLASTALSAHLFRLSGGVSGEWQSLFPWPLPVATAVYFLVNTGLVASAVALERGLGLFAVWCRNFRWTAAAYFSGLTLALGMLVALEQFGPWGLAIGIPPLWLLIGFYAAHFDHVRERERRIRQVEALNETLEAKVAELETALGEVHELRGLLPICMHCKSIRDDDNTWHQIEAYISEHSDASFTHSCCEKCRDTHYDLEPQEPSRRT